MRCSRDKYPPFEFVGEPTAQKQRRVPKHGSRFSMDPDSNRAVHRSEAAYGVGNAVPGCAYCLAAVIKESQGSVPEENNPSQGNDGEE